MFRSATFARLPDFVRYALAPATLLTILVGCVSSIPDQAPVLVRDKPGTVTHRIGLQAAIAFERARLLVEKETDTTLNHVQLRLVSNTEIQQEVTRETRRLVNNEFGDNDYAKRFLTKIVADQTGSYAALYVGTTRNVLISRSLLKTYLSAIYPDHSKADQALMALLIHELVHAADDVNYGIHKNRELGFKASFTQSAAFEGHAQMITRRICSRENCLPGLQALDKFMFETTPLSDPVAQSVQAISRHVLEYSYVEGERFLTELSQRADGDVLISNVLSSPPEDPVQILVPQSYPDTSREDRNKRLITSIRNANHPWTNYPWTTVETSPIKGIDVRNSPDRRKAAVEGFTKLIISMTGAQLYNQEDADISPIELMLIEAESPDTARLFANSFINRPINHDPTKTKAITPIQLTESVPSPHDTLNDMDYHTFLIERTTDNTSEKRHTTLVGLTGNYVIQVSGMVAEDLTMMKSFARSIITPLVFSAPHLAPLAVR